MDKTKREDLEKAYRKEQDSRVVPRMLAVHMVCVRKISIGETAANLMRSERRVHKWLERFDAGGLDGLGFFPKSADLQRFRAIPWRG
jgi:transposase